MLQIKVTEANIKITKVIYNFIRNEETVRYLQLH